MNQIKIESLCVSLGVEAMLGCNYDYTFEFWAVYMDIETRLDMTMATWTQIVYCC